MTLSDEEITDVIIASSPIPNEVVDYRGGLLTPEGRDTLARAMARNIMLMTDNCDDCEELKKLWTIMTYAQSYLSKKDDQMRARQKVLDHLDLTSEDES